MPRCTWLAHGGFGVSQLSYYNSAFGKLWLERSGTNVIANFRGGGEFGTVWHTPGGAKRSGCRTMISRPLPPTWCAAA